MGDRMDGKAVVVVGAGQTPGETVGNGRAMAVLFAREGGKVLCVDRIVERAEETAELIVGEGGEALAMAADVTKAADCARIIDEAKARFGRVDVLINNVGIGGGDAPAHRLEEAAFDRIMAVNLKGMWLVTKAALAVMREQGDGAIVNISSLAARAGGIQMAYEISKAGVNRLTTSVAQSNARYGIRCNAIMMGYIDTPMAVSGIATASGRPTSEVRAERDARVPLGGKMGTGWDTAYAALFLASDEARFISGAILPVDGAMGVRIG
jgi:NAD(P)-dependent dehydrogenase (short-subunit alcohol dehydrogenase family)